MTKVKGQRGLKDDQSNATVSAQPERAVFISFAQAPKGQPQQSLYETKWAAYQKWAAVERADHNFGPCLTAEGRAALEAHRGSAND